MRDVILGMWVAAMCSGCTTTPDQPKMPLLSQPTEIPGNWDIEGSQPLPPLASAMNRSAPGWWVYGLYTWAGEYHQYREDIQEIGWRSLRFAGPFDDAAMQAVAEDGATVMVTLSNRLLDPTKGKDRTAYPSDDALLADYTQKVDDFIRRYGPEGSFFVDHPETPKHPVTDIELWNEPNFQYLIPPDKRPRVESETAREQLYARLLTDVYPVIKKQHPAVNLVGFAAGGMSAGDLRFIEHVHEARPGVAHCYDVLSTHPYVRPAAPEANSVQSWGSYSIARNLEIIRETMGKHGRADAPVWYTELGWPISQDDGGRFATPPGKAFVSPLLQAAYVCRAYAFALRLNVERVHIMFVSDTDNFNGGFFLRDGTWRPSATAVQQMMRLMPNPRLVACTSDGEAGYYAYTFLADAEQEDSPSNRVLMAWNVGGPRTVELKTDDSSWRVTDMLGATQTRTASGGRIAVEIGPCPIYFQLAE